MLILLDPRSPCFRLTGYPKRIVPAGIISRARAGLVYRFTHCKSSPSVFSRALSVIRMFRATGAWMTHRASTGRREPRRVSSGLFTSLRLTPRCDSGRASQNRPMPRDIGQVDKPTDCGSLSALATLPDHERCRSGAAQPVQSPSWGVSFA
jgi:hypothetical protein